MAKKKEIDDYCKESGYSRADLKRFYDEAKEVNWILQKYSEEGNKWNNLPIHQIKQLPGLRERTLENIRKSEEEKAAKEAANKKNAEDKKYYEENFEKIMHDKIINHEELTERELSRLVFEYEVDSDDIDELRWNILTETIFELCGKQFKVEWQRAKTEMQEHHFLKQPVAV